MIYERKKSLKGLIELRLETIPLVESEDENLLSDDQGEKHKYLLFKAPTGIN